MLDKRSSDNNNSFHPFSKERFGPEIPVQQCGQHFSGKSGGKLFKNVLIEKCLEKLFETLFEKRFEKRFGNLFEELSTFFEKLIFFEKV